MVLERHSNLIIHEFNQLKTDFFDRISAFENGFEEYDFWWKIRKPVENIIFDRISAVTK